MLLPYRLVPYNLIWKGFIKLKKKQYTTFRLLHIAKTFQARNETAQKILTFSSVL